jgi:hypothetical protein
MYLPKFGIALALAVVLLLTVPALFAGVGLATGPSSPGHPPPPGSTVTTTLALRPGNNASSTLWGTTISPRANLLPNEGDLVNATPDRTVLWPGGTAGDKMNPFNDTTVGFDRKALAWSNVSTNITQFAAWCKSIGCIPIMQVPGEIDDPILATEILVCANTPTTGTCYDPTSGTNIPGWGLDPAYWEIGNEPGLWTEWRLPWSQWSDTGTNLTNPSGYAAEVEQYIQNFSRVDPQVRVIGLPGLGTGVSGLSVTWVNDIYAEVAANGSQASLAGTAIHVYPGGDVNATVKPTLGQFYGALAQGNATSSWNRTNEALDGICLTRKSGLCVATNGRLFLTEIGTALSHDGFAPYSPGFPGALGTADEAIQELEFPGSELASVDLYGTVFDTNNAWFNLTGGARPSYTLASQILSHLGTNAFPVNTSNANLEAIVTIDRNASDRHDFLVVNTALNDTIDFNTNFLTSAGSIPPAERAAAFSPSMPVLNWTWAGVDTTITVPAGPSIYGGLYNTSAPATPGPVVGTVTTGLPGIVSVAPQSLVLFESYNAPAYPVNFSESGLNLSATSPTSHWFLDVNGTRTATNQSTLTLLLPGGSYPTSGPPVLVPHPGSALLPVERLLPNVPSLTTVSAAPVNVSFGFIREWAINISWNAARGSVTAVDPIGASPIPIPSWWVNDTTLQLQVVPSTGFAFTDWYGRGFGNAGQTNGNGSVSGYNLTQRVTPTGPIDEVGIFLPGQPVDFVESGLPSGTVWNVSLRGLNESSSSSSQTFYEVNSTLGGWSYNIPNVTIPGSASGPATVYRFDRSVPAVVVNGTPVTILVNFSELFPITFTESGLPTNHSWVWNVYVGNGSVVRTNGSFSYVANSAANPSIVVAEANSTQVGGWGYVVPYVYPAGTTGYRPIRTEWNGTQASGPDGNLTLAGAPLTVQITFVPLTPPQTEYPVTFIEVGLPQPATWSLDFENVSSGPITGRSTTFMSTNTTTGARSYIVPQVTDHGNAFGVTGSNGTVEVDGAPVTVYVTFERLYNITFMETGLRLPQEWNVSIGSVNATTVASTGSSFGREVYLEEPNSTAGEGWGFLAYASPAYHFNRTLDRIAVHGANVTVRIHFDPLLSATIEETGLAAGTTWSATVKGVLGTDTLTSNTPDLTFFEVTGAWGIWVQNVSGYRLNWWNQTLIVGGVNMTMAFTYIVDTPPGYRWAASFVESGLPVGTSWSITVAVGTTWASTNSSSTNTILVGEPNGTWGFHVANISIRNSTTGNLSTYRFNRTQPYLSVDGAPVTVRIEFVELFPQFPVTFVFTGLPPGDHFQVRLQGTMRTAAATVVQFDIGNGTFDFDVMPPAGYFALPSHGDVRMNGHAMVVSIAFFVVGRGPTPPFWILVAPAALTASALVLSGLGAFALMGAIRRRRMGAAL